MTGFKPTLLHAVLAIASIWLLIFVYSMIQHHTGSTVLSSLSKSRGSLSARKKTAMELYEDVEKLVTQLEDEVLRAELAKASSALGVHRQIEKVGQNNVANEKEESVEILSYAKKIAAVGRFEAENKPWRDQLYRKLFCILHAGYRGGSAMYLYHVRKAAGTTMRDVLQFIGQKWGIELYETEGIVLDPRYPQSSASSFASGFPSTTTSTTTTTTKSLSLSVNLIPNAGLYAQPGVLTVTTLRDPISRVLSMYWYEHVGWFDGVLKQRERCHTLREWVETWRDGSPWKRDFMRKNPGSVYIEIENYYVKMLIGWSGQHDSTKRSSNSPDRKLTTADLEMAKAVLARFDLVFITEWMSDATQVDAMNAIFPGRSSVAPGHKIRGDFNTKERLKDTLAADEAEIRTLLTEMNQLDLQLFDYAQSLISYRLKQIPPLVAQVRADLHRIGKGGRGEVMAVGSSSSSSNKGFGYIQQGYGKNGEGIGKESAPKCPSRAQQREIKRRFKDAIGVFQPPGHKAPL